MLGGYCGRILHVDLGSGNTKTEALDVNMARKFMGDFGMNLRLAYDLIEPGIDPLSTQNVIILGAGPLVGTRIQAPRWSATTKLPLTNAISCASGGMGFGTRMKRAGYDHLAITGRAPKPVYLKITDENVEVCDAEGLWGRDIFDTTDILWGRLGKEYSVVAIGQAGENRVRLALAFVDKISSLGKGGLAAVMATKNLKAIAIKGTKSVPVADERRWTEVSGRFLRLYKDDPEREHRRKLGKMTSWRGSLEAGMPYKNWTQLYPRDKADELFGIGPFLRHDRKRLGCLMCMYQCKDVLEVNEGEFKGLATCVSSVPGRAMDLGVKFCLDDYDQFVKLIDTCNRYGIDTHVFASVSEFAIELYDKGIITSNDTNGLILKHDFKTALELVKMTAFREGIGDVIADGSLGVVKRFGRECERYSVHIKGLDQQTDPRTRQFNTDGFEQVVNPEGASVLPGYVGGAFRKQGLSREVMRAYCVRMDVPKASVDKIFDVKTYYNSARLLRYAEDFFVLLTSLGICEYRTAFYDWSKLGELYSAATGIEVTGEGMKVAGERIWNMYKAVNVREGFDREDDRFPQKWLEALRTEKGEERPLISCGGEAITLETLNKLLDDYYDERGWDVKRGIPTLDKLTALEMGDIAEDLGRRGLF